MTPPALVVSVHDVAPATAAETRRWCADLDERGIPVTLLVVPGPWRPPVLTDDPAFTLWLADRVERGAEIVLHGWAHQAGSAGGWRRRAGAVLARGAAEFAALDETAAYRLLRAGLSTLDALGLPAAGFTPPGWLHSPGTLAALRRLGVPYTTSHRWVYDLRHGTRLPGFAWSHRPAAGAEWQAEGAARRAGAALLASAAERAGSAVLRGGSAVAGALGGVVRIALHPADLARPGPRAATLAAIDRLLARGARPVTYSGLLAGRR
jgi:uncharacterized protein